MLSASACRETSTRWVDFDKRQGYSTNTNSSAYVGTVEFVFVGSKQQSGFSR